MSLQYSKYTICLVNFHYTGMLTSLTGVEINDNYVVLLFIEYSCQVAKYVIARYI